MKFRFPLLIPLLFFISSPGSNAQYLWPTEASNYLSSTFGETRSAHFHAALDIKTWGREGYEVYASKDGWVYRLLTTVQGYGKAIYLKHDDSTFTVYAHLQRFNDPLRRLSDSIRMKDHRFEFDQTVIKDSIRVRKGDVIGYSGSTGIGPPHLHFEVRDREQDPINPLLTNLQVEDTLPPVLSSIMIEPLNAGSGVKGQARSFTFAAERKQGIFDFGMAEVAGRVGLSVDAYDMADRVNNKYAVYSLTLMQDTDTLFHEVLDKFSYENEAQMFMDRAAPFPNGRRGYQRLFQKDGGENPFLLVLNEKARIEASDDTVSYEIICRDFYGNTSRGKIRITRGPEIPEMVNDTVQIPPQRWYWENNWFSQDGTGYTHTGGELPGTRLQKGHSLYPSLRDHELEFFRAQPGDKQYLHSSDRSLTLSLPSKALFDSMTIAYRSFRNQDGDHQISLQPQMIPLRSEFRISYYHTDIGSDPSFRLFRIDPEDNELSYVDSYIRGNTLHAFPSELGEFVVKADRDAPEISDLQLYQTEWGMWQVSARVEDELSGIDHNSAIFLVNGKRGIAEYDYEEDLLIYYLPGFRPDEENMISLEIKDRAGNQAFIREQL